MPRGGWVALAVVVSVAGCTTTAPSPAVPPAAPAAASPDTALLMVHDPGHVTGTVVGPCHSFGGGQLPDPHCTPGSVDPTITAAQLCSGSYRTSGYRPPSSQTSAFKHQVAFPAYGVPDGTTAELDHLVSLELGGSNDAANLWPEVGPVPNPKDKVEGRLHRWVCAADGPEAEDRLRRAQDAIAVNWPQAEAALGINR